MPNPKKSSLKRFKKTMDGIIELATIIEQAAPPQRNKILVDAAKEDPEFLQTTLKRVVFFDEFLYLDEGIVAEILTNVSPRLLAYAIKKSHPDFKKAMLRHLSHVGIKQAMDEDEQIKDSVPDSFILGAQRQILKIARQLEAKGRFVFEVADCPRFRTPRKTVAKRG